MINVVSALILAAAMSGSVTLNNSNTSFREALSACPSALGSVSFALHHARIAANSGAYIDEELNPSGTISAMLQTTDGTKSARLMIDQTRRTVDGKHVTTARGGRVACIHPD